jgi:hypothetical protein
VFLLILLLGIINRSSFDLGKRSILLVVSISLCSELIIVEIVGHSPGGSFLPRFYVFILAMVYVGCPTRDWTFSSFSLVRDCYRLNCVFFPPCNLYLEALIPIPHGVSADIIIYLFIFVYLLIYFSFVYFSFIAVTGGGTLWYLHRLLQCIKYIMCEFTPLTILLRGRTGISGRGRCWGKGVGEWIWSNKICTHVIKWKNYTCWNHSRNWGGGIRMG